MSERDIIKPDIRGRTAFLRSNDGQAEQIATNLLINANALVSLMSVDVEGAAVATVADVLEEAERILKECLDAHHLTQNFVPTDPRPAGKAKP